MITDMVGLRERERERESFLGFAPPGVSLYSFPPYFWRYILTVLNNCTVQKYFYFVLHLACTPPIPFIYFYLRRKKLFWHTFLYVPLPVFYIYLTYLLYYQDIIAAPTYAALTDEVTTKLVIKISP